MSEIEYIKARIDLVKTVISGLFLTMFGLAVYNVQSSGAKFTAVIIALILFGSFGIHLGRVWKALVNELKEPKEEKMINPKETDFNKEKPDLNETGCSLSVESWIEILNSEINNLDNEKFQYLSFFYPSMTILAAVGIAIIGWMLMIPSINLPTNSKVDIFNALSSSYKYIVLLFFILVLSFVFGYLKSHTIEKKVKRLKNIREEIISGNLKDANKIHDEWKKIVYS